MRRLLSVARLVALRRVDRAVIFAAHGASFYEKGAMALIARRFGVRVVFSPRSGFLLEELPASPAMARFARRVFAASSTVLCQSAFWRDFYARYTDEPGKIAVVQNWIDVDAYPVGAPEARFGVTTVLFMGWVVREKGVYELLDAVGALVAREDVPPFELVLCGGGDALEDARRIVRERGLDGVRLEGWVGGERKAELLRRSHVCVQPSHAEGLSNVLLEAMASGLALVSTDVGAAPDVVDEGRTGLLVPPRSAAALEEALATVLGDAALRERLGAAARRRVETENAIDVGVGRFFDVLLDESTPAPPPAPRAAPLGREA